MPGPPSAFQRDVRPSGRNESPAGRSDRDFVRDDVDDAAAAAGAELDGARREREQRVVATAADDVAGVEVRATLTDEDLAGVDELAAETLDAEALSVGVTAVTAGGCTIRPR